MEQSKEDWVQRASDAASADGADPDQAGLWSRMRGMGPLLEAQALDRIFTFSGDTGRPGSSFTIDVGQSQYLITANHLTTGDREELVTLGNAYVQGHQQYLSRVDDPDRHGEDLAVFLMGDAIVSCGDLPLDATGVSFSGEVLIAGFPAFLSPDWSETPLSLNRLPMLKKGILGWMGHVAGQHVMRLDILANPGFSGGPVLFRNRDGRMAVAGIISGTFTQGPDDRLNLGERAYAGITQAAFGNTARKAIEAHQAGRSGPRALY